MFIKNRRLFFLLFTVFFALFFCQAFPLAVYASDNVELVVTNGIRRKSDSQLNMYGTSNSFYNYYRVFYASGADLNSLGDLYLKNTNTNSVTLQICSSTKSKPAWNPLSGSTIYNYNFTSSLLYTKTYSGNSTYKIDYSSFDDNLYYYFFTGPTANTTTVLSTNLYAEAAAAPTPTPVPTPTPTPTPTPVPTPTPDVGDYPGKAIVDQFSISQNEAVYPNQSFKVFPYSVEIAESTDPPDIEKGKAYVLHYKFSFPARFFYDGHSGSGYSYPTVMEDLAIEPYYVNTGNNSFSFGQSDVYIDNDQISCDYLNNLQSHTGSTGNKSYLSGKVGYALLNVPVVDTLSLYSYDLTVEWSAVLTKFDNDIVPPQANDLSCTVTIGTISYEDQFRHVSDQLDSDALSQIKDNTGAIKDEQEKQNEIDNQHYQDEQDKISEAESNITDGASQLTETLSSWEIFTMPFQIVQDFAGAIASDGSTGLTFPSFTLMGQQLWPSYTFDLQVIAQKFPALYNALHLITGIMVVSWFIHYCWRKWHILIGDDMPEDT